MLPIALKDLVDWLVPTKGRIDSRVPIGFTGQGCIWYADAAPQGWLICDGSLVAIEDYKALFLLLGNSWGVATATHFYLPDLRQRVPVGKHSSGTFNTLNNSGGAETHTLTINETPSHFHDSYVNGDVNYPIGITGGSEPGKRANAGSIVAAFNGYPFRTNSVGGGAAHNNLQPYRVVNFIIKI